jgi:hypothetical protein
MTPSADRIVYLDDQAENGSFLSVPRLVMVSRQ